MIKRNNLNRFETESHGDWREKKHEDGNALDRSSVVAVAFSID